MGGVVVAEVLSTTILSTEQLEAIAPRTGQNIVVLEADGVNFTLSRTLEVEFEKGIFGNSITVAEGKFFPAIAGNRYFCPIARNGGIRDSILIAVCF